VKRAYCNVSTNVNKQEGDPQGIRLPGY